MRLWATLGNIYRIEAVLSVIGTLPLAYFTIQRFQLVGADDVVVTYTVLIALNLVLCWLFWMVKPVLISGRPLVIGPIVRFLVGLGTVISVIFSLGLALIPIGIVYLFTAEPDPRDYAPRAPTPQAPRFKAPSNWQPNANVGPSGAMIYSDALRSELVGHFPSYVPVQVLDERDGYSQVVAATGEAGWVDNRTVARSA